MLNLANCALPECGTALSHPEFVVAKLFSAHKRSIFPYFDDFGNSESRSSYT
jgi:hypothetical protein